jgi:5-methyltetrahydropteroyltriglutamate--homocysteine methyltransferase
LAEFRKIAAMHVEALNHALTGISPEQVRIHLCWGNYEGPHHHDGALCDIIDIFLQANVGAISYEAANPRHEHEWEVFAEVKLPAGKALIPGVIDSASNFIEHPELIAQRLCRVAELVGRETCWRAPANEALAWAGTGETRPCAKSFTACLLTRP